MISALLVALSFFPHDVGYLWDIIYVSLYVSLIAVLLSTIVGVPIALLIGFRSFPGRQFVIALINTGMGFPSVVVGLIVLFAVSNQGPFGSAGFDLVFTKEAMILSQIVLAAPVIIGVSLAAVTSVDRGIRDAAHVMGGTRIDVALVVIKEGRYGILTGVLAGLGRAISEVGSVLIVGGNIEGSTRTLTTAIQLEARQGQFEVAFVLGAVLVTLVLIVNGLLLKLGGDHV